MEDQKLIFLNFLQNILLSTITCDIQFHLCTTTYDTNIFLGLSVFGNNYPKVGTTGYLLLRTTGASCSTSHFLLILSSKSILLDAWESNAAFSKTLSTIIIYILCVFGTINLSVN